VRMPRRLTWLAGLGCLVLVCACPARPACAATAAEGTFAPAFARADVDVANCRAASDGKAVPPAADVLGSLGLDAQRRGWAAGSVSGENAPPRVFQYVVAFNRPVTIGSVLLRGTVQTVAFLKADAPYPPVLPAVTAAAPQAGAAADAAHVGQPAQAGPWQTVAIPPNQSGARLVTLPAGTQTRALLLTDRRSYGGSRIDSLRCLAGRLRNVTPQALAYAEREYTVRPSMSPPYTLAASCVTTGRMHWQSAGPDQNERVIAPPISDVMPTWFMVCWDSPRTVRGLWLAGNLRKFDIQRFTGPEGLNPRAATEAEWETLAPASRRADGEDQWVALEPVSVAGLRLRILKAADEKIARIEGLHVLVDAAGDTGAPAATPATGEEPAPLAISYQTPADGEVTVVVNDSAGRRVRNLVARAERAKGPQRDAWDLRDDAGLCVGPGEYRWEALFHPPLKLKYQLCPYPNVTSASPWLNGASGPGGWLADHTPPDAVCTAGDGVYLGAPCAESGVSFIACDLGGNKQWGIHSFAAWTGPRRLASDGTTVFVANDKTDVWGVTLADHKVAKVATMTPTAGRKGSIRGLAARDGRLYMSLSEPGAWLASAAGACDVDILNCLPKYPKAEKARGSDPPVDPRTDFLKLLRLTGPPAGCGVRGMLTYLETTDGPEPRQHVLVCFGKPVPIGTIVYPVPGEEEVSVRFWTLKAEAPYPPDVRAADQWTPFESQGARGAWDTALPPKNTVTRALRVSFTRGKDDALAEVGGLGGLGDSAPSPAAGAGGGRTGAGSAIVAAGANWRGRLEGLKLLRRRYVNVAAAAKVRVNSGKLLPDGTWDAQRTKAVRESDPSVYVLEWPQPQALRGLAIKEIDGRLTKIDVYEGDAAAGGAAAASAAVPLDGTAGWKEIATYTQDRRDFYQQSGNRNEKARYVDGYVDFGREVTTRAVRLRVVEQWLQREHMPYGVRDDQGGQVRDATRCRIYGVAALKYVGGEPPVEAKAHARVVEYDPKAGTVLREAHVEEPGELAFNAAGDLLAISGKQIVKVDWSDGGQSKPLGVDVEQPAALAFGPEGSLHVFDAGKDRGNIRVFDPACLRDAVASPAGSKPTRTIGKAGGGRQAGPYDPNCFGAVIAMAVDKLGQDWAVEWDYWPKRISLWGPDGKWKRDFLGPTEYGGGGALDAWDKTRLFYGPLEFALDWPSGATRLKSITWRGATPAEDLAVHLNGRVYLVTRASSPDPTRSFGQVFLYDAGRCRLVAAMGTAETYPLLNTGDFLAQVGRKILTGCRFSWSDLNADGAVQAGEVQLFDPPAGGGAGADRIPGVTRFARDLSCQAGTVRYEVEKFLPDGTPVYRQKVNPALIDQPYYQLADGKLYRMGDGQAAEAAVTPDGREVWAYPTEGRGVHSLYSAKPWRPDQIVAQFTCVGQETAHAGDLGEFLVFSTNVGTWNLWTADGLLAGRIFRDIRDPARAGWSMLEHNRGLDVTDVTAGQEHFQGYFGKTPDNRYYVVAGHNNASVVEVEGIDQYRRFRGTLAITPAEIRTASAYGHRVARKAVYRQTPVLECYRLNRAIAVDGEASDWGDLTAAEIDAGHGQRATFRIGYDDRCLYLCYEARGLGPMKNTGEDWHRAFKTGACVDLQIGADPAAPLKRDTPAAGDIRLLLTFLGGQGEKGAQAEKPTAVLYQPTAPRAAAGESWKVSSPVGEAQFDRVVALTDVRLAHGQKGDTWVVEASIPLASLGLTISPGQRRKIDWGVLVSGKDGHEVLRRIYWANQATDIVSDEPSEARLHPDLWGYARFHDAPPTAATPAGELGEPTLPKPAKPKTAGELIDDMLKGGD
jgi:hypothetical protein